MALPSKSRAPRTTKGAHRSLEQSVLYLAVIAGLPAGLGLLALSWGQPVLL